MKLSKASTGAYWIGIFAIASSSLLWYKRTDWLALLPYLNWVIAAAALLFCLSPKANLRMQNNLITESKTSSKKHKQNSSFFSYQIRIMIVQLALAGSIYSIYAISNTLFTPENTANAISFASINYQNLTHYGLFPWPTIAAISALFSYYCYHKKQTASLSNLTVNKISKRTGKSLGIAFNLSTRIATVSALGCSISAATVLSAEWVMQRFNTHLPHGISIFCFFFGLAVFFTVKSKATLKIVRKLFKQGRNSFQIAMIFSVVLTAIMLIYGKAIPSLLGQDINKKVILNAAVSWKSYSLYLNYLWWFSWTLPLSLWICLNSAGQRLRNIIITPCILPAIALAGMYYLKLHNISFIATSLNHTIAGWQVLSGLLSMIVLLSCFTDPKRLTMLYSGECSLEANNKYRNPAKALAMVLFGSGISIFFMLQTGMRSLSFIYCVQFLPAAVMIYISLLGWPIVSLINRKK